MNEQQKYETVWKNPKYRKCSPEVREIARIFQYGDPKEGEHVIVLGVGSGRAAKQVKDERKCYVTGVDIAHNCLNPDVKLDQFIVTNLWENIPTYKHDLGICVDVMEHIPAAHTDASLRNIKGVVDRIYFRIPNFQHHFMDMDLHQVVQEPEWWTAKLGEVFGEVKYLGKLDWLCRP